MLEANQYEGIQLYRQVLLFDPRRGSEMRDPQVDAVSDGPESTPCNSRISNQKCCTNLRFFVSRGGAKDWSASVSLADQRKQRARYRDKCKPDACVPSLDLNL